ncbi:MAG: hypothetical protein ACK6CP_08585 [Pseudanabaena sp.]|nr:hypothetical protein [Pseudanabaena sp. M110S1SP2A07QC]
MNGNPDFVFWLDVTVCKSVRLAIVQWLAAIQEVALQNSKLDDALCDRLVKGIAELNAIAECLEENAK